MGLNKTSSAAKWVALSKGVFIVRRGEEVEEYASFSGLLVGIGFVDKAANPTHQIPASRQMILSFQCGAELYKIGLNSVSGYGRSIKLKLPMLDLTREFELVPSYKADTKDASCFINQFGVTIKQKWTRENPGDLPPAESAKLGGKTVWDFSDQEKWLESYLLDTVGPIAAANLVRPHDTSSHQGEAMVGDNQDENPEDGSGVPADSEDTPF